MRRGLKPLSFDSRQLERIATALERLAPEPTPEQRRKMLDRIETAIHEFDKSLCRPPVERPPLSQTQREVLAQEIFERLMSKGV